MALSVYQNLYAFTSQRHLAVNQSALGKSIERLSSGLRINHAADDASGMAISEKMRGQISGMKRASMNAQDGISYLQTAEGAMEASSSILQRMRELAVQAANGTYTSNDRLEIQKEVDQLKEELDRVSTATEFNTRKLINGEGTGLWSASSNQIEALMRGPFQEGNYEITMSVDPGKNQIQKSNILTLRDGALGAELGVDSAGRTINTTNLGYVSEPKTIDTGKYEVGVLSASGGGTVHSASLTGTYQASSSTWSATVATNAGTPPAESGYFEVEFLAGTTAGATVADNAQIKYRWIDAKTGAVEPWSSPVTVAADTAALTTPSGGIVDITFPNGFPMTITKGDKMLVAVTGQPPAGTGHLGDGGGGIKIDGPGGSGPTVWYGPGEITIKDNGDEYLDTNTVTQHIISLDGKTGNVNLGSIDMNFKENGDAGLAGNEGITTGGMFVMMIRGAGDPATSTTKLKDLKQFVDADGNMIFDNKQELTIYGNGTKVVVHLEGNDTIGTLVEKLTKAVVQDLGMGADDPQVNKNLVQYVSIPNTSGNAWDSVKGTLLIQSALTGSQGELSFIGDQRLLNGLGLNVVQQAESGETHVTIRDAHTGALIGRETTGDDRIYTLIDGVEIMLDSRAGVIVSWDATGGNNNIVFTSNDQLVNRKHYLHLVDNRTSLQIGANKGQDIDVSIPQLDLKGLGLENTVMVTQKHAQQAIGEVDAALTKVVTARATVGAQISRLEYTIQNLATSRENLTTSESRIRDLDIAEESTNFAKYQILVQSGIAMLAQANTIPQMALQLIQGR